MPLVEAAAAPLLKDLWAARDEYIDVVLDRSRASKDRFFARHSTHILSPEERVEALELMELERHAQLMYTSCGWFFDEVSGIETVQIIAYAGRVLQLAAKLFGSAGAELEAKFLEILEQAKSNVPEIGDGAELYRKYVLGIRVNLEQVGAHYAISSVFRNYPEDGELFCYELHRDGNETLTSGRGKVALGSAHIRSTVTEETQEFCYAVLHLGDQNLSAAVRPCFPTSASEMGEFSSFSSEVRKAIGHANLPEVVRQIDRLAQLERHMVRDAQAGLKPA